MRSVFYLPQNWNVGLFHGVFAYQTGNVEGDRFQVLINVLVLGDLLNVPLQDLVVDVPRVFAQSLQEHEENAEVGRELGSCKVNLIRAESTCGPCLLVSFLAQLVKSRVPETIIVPIFTLRTLQSYLNNDFIYRLKPRSLLIEVFRLIFEFHHYSFDLLLHTLAFETLLCLLFPTFKLLEVLF